MQASCIILIFGAIIPKDDTAIVVAKQTVITSPDFIELFSLVNNDLAYIIQAK